MNEAPEKWRWFGEARYGLFIHWGPAAAYGRGEQVLFREHLDQRAYGQRACAWNPQGFDAKQWADAAVRGGFKYAVLTTRHHDGFCLWDTKTTDYSTAAQTPKRDFVRAYVEAFGEAGLRVGLYYSLADWRVPAYWCGPEQDPDGFEQFRQYVHDQVEELLTHYGQIDLMFFDGAWPHGAQRWQSEALIDKMRAWQPNILINNRLDCQTPYSVHGSASEEAPGHSVKLGDYGTPEHEIIADPDRIWESCQVSTWRLWGYAKGERWRPAEVMLDMLVDCAAKGGNLIMNVGPDADGRFPGEFIERAEQIGDWLKVHGEAIYASEGGDVCEFITFGYQTRKGNNLYLVIRFWHDGGELTLAGLATKVRHVQLLTTGDELAFEQTDDHLIIRGLPAKPPTDLFPVIKVECDDLPQPCDWAKDRLWSGDPRRMLDWAKARGTSVWADGKER